MVTRRQYLLWGPHVIITHDTLDLTSSHQMSLLVGCPHVTNAHDALDLTTEGPPLYTGPGPNPSRKGTVPDPFCTGAPTPPVKEHSQPHSVQGPSTPTPARDIW